MKVYMYITKHVPNTIKIILKESCELKFWQDKIKILKKNKIKILKNDLQHMKHYLLD